MFKNRITHAIVLLLALVLALGGIALEPTPAAAAGNTVTIGSDSVYAILSDGSRTVEYNRCSFFYAKI